MRHDVRNLPPREPNLHGEMSKKCEEEGECERVHRGIRGGAELSLC